MKRFIEGQDRTQGTLLPECIDDYVADDNSVRVIDAFVDELDLRQLGFEGVEAEETGRPAYHPSTLLKIYIYGYLNRVQSSRRLERESQRNLELIWLTGRLMPDFKTIADFRKDNGQAIRRVCREFTLLCRRLELFSQAIVAIDGSKFKAVNHRDRNFTSAKMKLRMELIEQSIAEYLEQLDRMDRRRRDAHLFVRSDGEPWHRMAVSRVMREASKAARLDPPATFHDLRRTYASLLINAGASAETIQKLLGHSDTRMTLRVYAHILDTTLAKEVEAKPPSFGFEPGNVRTLRP